jgi:hypothetical protein
MFHSSVAIPVPDMVSNGEIVIALPWAGGLQYGTSGFSMVDQLVDLNVTHLYNLDSSFLFTVDDYLASTGSLFIQDITGNDPVCLWTGSVNPFTSGQNCSNWTSYTNGDMASFGDAFNPYAYNALCDSELMQVMCLIPFD